MATQSVKYTEGEWQSADGLTLRYRDYGSAAGEAEGAAAQVPIVCLPGLTRNARDFESLAMFLSHDCSPQRRVISPDLRGRGQSDYAKDSATYVPAQYAQDIKLLLDELGIERAILIGTALGGIVTLHLAGEMPDRIAGALLNDIGPEITPSGLGRIREYVGLGRSFPTWMHAARALRENGRVAHPDYVLDDWLGLAKQIMCVGSNSRIVFDYDMHIAEPFKQLPMDASSAQPLWQAFDALAQKPLTVVRGELSDILSVQTLAAMRARAPKARFLTIARTGHAPSLNEPAARAAIAEWLQEL